ncbi:MAG: protein-tyrosine-phosphatase [Bacteroidetes bacterium HGW-Bacteroidetes-21]|jgi:protein-tyrosine phosphatase|nr:MAG: protein-tyrosine-phosphatase [Bacteroidetes bacterium HGW-Bacteroidetes-21]
MKERPNILVVCGRNKKRSRTAEYIFKNDQRFKIRSAGLSSKSERVLNEKDILWADLIFVMDNGQRNRVWRNYLDIKIPPIEVLEIDDNYEYLDEELISLLKDRINGTLKYIYKL